MDNVRLLFGDGPSPIATPTVIAVPDEHYDPMEHKGELDVVSPEEDRLVILKAVERDLEDPTKAANWAKHLRSVPLKFEILNSIEDRHFKDVSIREVATARQQLISRTAYGRMLEIWNFKIKMETHMHKISNFKLAEMCP